MLEKAPVVLVVLVETARLRWFVAGIGLDGQAVALLRSEIGDLARYQELDFDEQVAFLRHRFCGVLQRGCDRLWERSSKACQFVFLFDQLLPDPTGRLTQAFAEHIAGWLHRPPVVLFEGPGESIPAAPPRLQRLAGEIERPLEELLLVHVPSLLATRADLTAWELSPGRSA